MKFKVGDKVKLHYLSNFYVDNTPENPRNTEGEVIFINNSFGSMPTLLDVVWSTGKSNCYQEKDLTFTEDLYTTINLHNELDSSIQYDSQTEFNFEFEKEFKPWNNLCCESPDIKPNFAGGNWFKVCKTCLKEIL